MALAATMVCGMFAGCGKDKAPEENTNTQVEQTVDETNTDELDAVRIDLSDMEDGAVAGSTDSETANTDENEAITDVNTTENTEPTIIVDDASGETGENGENTEVPEATIATDDGEGEWQ